MIRPTRPSASLSAKYSLPNPSRVAACVLLLRLFCEWGPGMTQALNKPVDLDDAMWTVTPHGPGGSAGMLWLDRDEVEQYNADPDGYVAKELGFTSVDEYREWVAVDGTALCCERTRAGHLRQAHYRSADGRAALTSSISAVVKIAPASSDDGLKLEWASTQATWQPTTSGRMTRLTQTPL